MEKTNFEGAKKFIEIKRSQNNESLCGHGSHKDSTRETVSFVNYIIKKYEIKSILDLGCGDWNWFNEIDLSDCSYVGWDADEAMIADNQSKYGLENVNFYVKDIFSYEYPSVDLIICRDVLFHVQHELATKLIDDAKVKSNFFLSTSFRYIKKNESIKKYWDIDDWAFFKINLNIPPFDLLDYEIDNQEEKSYCGRRKFLSLYEF